jgi:hypothetical protein
VIVNSGAQTIEFADGSAGAPSITNSGDTNTGIFFPTADTIAFSEGGTEAMRIDSTGQLLVGTTSGYDSNATGAITLNANAPDGTVNFKKGIVFASDGGDVQPVWAHGGITSTGSAGFNGNLIFGTDGDGTQSSTITERMRIDSSGNLNVGQSSGPNGGSRLGISNDCGVQAMQIWTNTAGGSATQNIVLLYRGASLTGSIQGTASSTAYNTSSDYRLKENVAPMVGALSKIALLKPCTYTWKINGTQGQGFIAHELQEIVPECVSGEKDAVDKDGKIMPQGIDTSFLVATLTAAIQEQQIIINDIKAELDNVKTELATLKGAPQ